MTIDNTSERLKLTSSIYNPYSQAFIKKCLQNQGGKALEIACGQGVMTCWLAELPGVQSVLGIDISPESIEKAKALSASLQLHNTEFRILSVYDLDLLKETFDIIYLRFVLIHLTNPLAALRAVYNKLNPNGLMICETAIHSHSFSTPSTTCYDQFIKLIKLLFSSQGKDADLGKQLYSLCLSLNFSIEDMNYSQPMLIDPADKKIMVLGFQRAKELFLKEKIVTQKELDSLEQQMAKEYLNPKSVWAAPTFCQVLAKKK